MGVGLGGWVFVGVTVGVVGLSGKVGVAEKYSLI